MPNGWLWLFRGPIADHPSWETIVILIINLVVEWDFAFYSLNVRNQQKMRKNFELKMGQQENYYLFTHKTGDAEQENQGENPTGTKE